jgi:hypothetical protein
MFALMQKKKEWEFQNHQVFLKLVRTSSDVSVESVKKAGLLTSFLVYLIYKTIRGMLALGAMMFVGPQLVRKVAPGTKPLKHHEFHQPRLEPTARTAQPWR